MNKEMSLEKIQSYTEKIRSSLEKESITPLERFIGYQVHHTEVDHLPVWAYWRGGYTRYLTGYKLSEITTNPGMLCETILAGLSRFRFDTVWPYPDVYSLEPEAYGCTVEYLEDAHTIVKEPVINDVEDLNSIELIDPKKDGRLPLVLKVIETLHNAIGDSHPILGHLQGPASLAASLRGSTRLLLDMKRNPELVHEIMNLAADTCVAFGKAQLDVGAIGISMSDAFASLPTVSPQLYCEFLIPYYKRIVDSLSRLTVGGVRWHSQVGFEQAKDPYNFIDQILHAGNGAIELQEPISLNLRRVKELCVEHGAMLWVRIHTMTLARGNPDEMKKNVRRYVEELGEGGHLLICAPISGNAKPEVIDAYIEALLEYGRMPLPVG
ncbi:MAG: hypothetical protein JSW01_01250 [Candidatus Bathyarchaeota archaeon]|nr:MAG: hypothetical protein JSW01_01250 [Candidatus Bathyarchaeota archaeon]